MPHPDESKRDDRWQGKLRDYCQSLGLSEPNYQYVSDRRGGRTAWTSVVNIASANQTFQARYWYDGQYLNNSKEDAAEVACQFFGSAPLAGMTAEGPSSSNAAGGANDNASHGGSPGSVPNDFSARGGMSSGFGGQNIMPGFANNGQPRHANAFGSTWNRGPAAQPGYPRPSW